MIERLVLVAALALRFVALHSLFRACVIGVLSAECRSAGETGPILVRGEETTTSNYYEALYILRTTLNEEQVDTAIAKYSKVVTDNGGEVIAAGRWDKRRLAYEIKGVREGGYILMYFTSTGSLPRAIARVFRISDEVLRHIIIRTEQKHIDTGRLDQVAADRARGLEPAAEPTAEPVVEPAQEAAAVEAAAVAEPAAEAAPEPVAEAAPEPVAEAAAEPVVEPVVDVAAGPVVEAAHEPAAEPVAEAAAEAPAEAPAEEAPKKPARRTKKEVAEKAAEEAEVTE